MSNVSKFYPKDAAKDPDAVLEQAVGVYEDVFILGYTRNSDELQARSTSTLNIGEILLMLETFKHKLIRGEYELDAPDDSVS